MHLGLELHKQQGAWVPGYDSATLPGQETKQPLGLAKYLRTEITPPGHVPWSD